MEASIRKILMVCPAIWVLMAGCIQTPTPHSRSSAMGSEVSMSIGTISGPKRFLKKQYLNASTGAFEWTEAEREGIRDIANTWCVGPVSAPMEQTSVVQNSDGTYLMTYEFQFDCAEVKMRNQE